MYKSKSVIGLLLVLACIGELAHGATISSFEWTESFSIYGHQPVPQVNGFDYWFSTELVDTSLRGATVRIDSIRVLAPSTNLGNVINWDMEVFLHGDTIGLPEGQFTQTHVDPWSGYTRIADTQFHAVIGAEATTATLFPHIWI